MKTLFFLGIVFAGFVISPVVNLHAQNIGGVAVNSSGLAPDSSAAFDVSSTIKGELMPRMTAAQRNAIVNPATGLFIYNTDCNVINYNAGTPAAPNWATVNASNVLVAGVSISASPLGAICSGTSVTFTAVPAGGINSPNYQWQVNGANTGANSFTYTDTALNNGDVVTCILTTNQACVTGSPATSNSVTMTVNPIPSTPGSITGNTSVCAASAGNIYSVSPVAGATSYNWTVPGDAAITSGSGNTSITVTFGPASGNISVAAFNSCGVSSASSQAVTVTSIPGTPGSIAGASAVCTNASGQVYSISGVSQATSYNWTVPAGASITSNSDTSVTVTFAANPSGTVAVSATNFCGTSGQSTLSISQTNVCSPLTLSYTGSIQTFTVPAGVNSLTIEAFGAQGGNHAQGQLFNGANYCGCTGGMGAEITGTFNVTPGEVLYVIVGGQGADDGSNAWNGGAGGGGGSFVYEAGPDLLIAAGGGGGGALADDEWYFDVIPLAPVGVGGQGGNCGSANRSCWDGGCNGGNGSGNLAGYGWNSIMANPNPCGCDGGYGGGGGDGDHGGGGGGGYSGGAGDTGPNGCSANYGDGGGGGGSYNTGTNQTNTGGVQNGNGQVIFTW